MAIATLAACGDESNTRQFAGGPQTPGSGTTPDATNAQGPVGSPTVPPTPMSIGALLEPHGDARKALVVHADTVVAIEIQSGESQIIWHDADRVVWAVTTDQTVDRVALLTAPTGIASGWSIDFVNASGDVTNVVNLGERTGTPAPIPDAVAAGRGGLDWIGESASVAVALPTGGLQQVFADGSQVRLLSATNAKRPAAVAVTQDAGTIAYVDQPSGSEGSGIYAGSMKAKPVDPIVVLPADRSGNRYASGVAWISPGNRVATVIEREEVGIPQGDLFYIDTETRVPQLAWTSPTGREVWSVESFAISDDGAVVTFLTNPSNPDTRKASSVWMMQIDGGTIERFDLPVRARTEQARVFAKWSRGFGVSSHR